VPHLDDVEEHQHGQHAGRRHLQVLRRHEGAPPVVAIGEDAADQREQDDRQLLQERVEAQEERRIRQRDDQPVLRHDLHPRADARGAAPNHCTRKVAIGERGEHPPHRAGPDRRRGRRHGFRGRSGCSDGFGQEFSNES
jgi:hypothetical protein